MAWSSLGEKERTERWEGEGEKGKQRHQSLVSLKSAATAADLLACPSPQPSIGLPDVINRGAEVMWAVGKSAVQAIFGAVAF